MIPLRDKRIVLIGGAGFIGHHLALRLREAGAAVTIVDGLSVNSLLQYAAGDDLVVNRALYCAMIEDRLGRLREAGVALHVQDARETEALASLLGELQPQVLVHLAGLSHAGRSNRDPQAAFEHTLRTLQNSLSASGDALEHFVYFSSSMVYGDFETGEVTEETPCRPIGIYGALKLAGEKIVIAHNQVSDLPYTIIRPSALYGERCVSRRVGQVFIEHAMQGLELTIAGDGSDRLDFTYIDDLVDGLLRVMSHEAARGETFNLTYGSARSIHDLAEIVCEAFPGVRVRYEERDRLMPSRGSLCVDKARTLLGYAPGCPLETGIPRYVEWYRRSGLIEQVTPEVVVARPRSTVA